MHTLQKQINYICENNFVCNFILFSQYKKHCQELDEGKIPKDVQKMVDERQKRVKEQVTE